MSLCIYEQCTFPLFQNVTKMRADGIGTVCGRLFVGTAEKIPACELIDTTGAGDAFIGAILYGKCNLISDIHSFLYILTIC